MKPATNTLTDIFNADVRYVVPLYQRPYVWDEEKHWEPLWQDVLVVLDHASAGEEDFAKHFLGAIVLDQEDTTPGQAMRRLVIDGQQRLTTLQLLLAAAARCAEDDGADRQARLLTKLIHNDPDLASGDERFKVWPTNANQAAFRDVMGPEAPPADLVDDPTNTVHEAYSFFRTAIKEWLSLDSEEVGDLSSRHEALRVALSAQLQIVTINLEPGDNAQVIFETLNARGTPLLALDLVKNAVFYRAFKQGAAVDDLNVRVWEPVLGDDHWREEIRQGRLTRPRAELFLMHWLAMRLARIIPAHELFNQFRAHVLDTPDKPRAETLLIELCRDAETFREFERQPPGSVEEAFFRRLEVLDTTTVLPIALLLYTTESVTIEQRRRGLVALESWLVRRMLCGYTTRGYNRLTADLLKLLKANANRADEVIVTFLRSSDANSAIWPSDDTIRTVLTDRFLYGYINQRRIVMLMSAIELDLRQSNKVEDIYTLPTNLTVEHVMPRKWEANWPLTDGYEAEARIARIDRLGNLTLTSGPLNSALSNSHWDIKRPELVKHSLLLLNQQVTQHDHWDETNIDRRGAELASAICRLWPGPDAVTWPAEWESDEPDLEAPESA